MSEHYRWDTVSTDLYFFRGDESLEPDEVVALLTDRDALVRYVRAYYKSHTEQRRAYEALSQELKDEIAQEEK